MHYVLRNQAGKIIGLRESPLKSDDSSKNDESIETEDWKEIEANHPDLIQYMEEKLSASSSFRESDIQLARVLEDLITLLIDRNVIYFTDFPPAAQKRLLDRQSMRRKNQLNNMIDDSEELI